MGKAGKHDVSVAYEASLEKVFLPRCASCHAPHPIAQKAADPTICPNCGEPTALAKREVVPATVSLDGIHGRLIRGFLWIAGVLRFLARRIRP